VIQECWADSGGRERRTAAQGNELHAGANRCVCTEAVRAVLIPHPQKRASALKPVGHFLL